MVKVSYQVIFKGEDFNKRDFREVLISILKEIFEGEYNELVEYVSWEDIIKINYCLKINEDKYIIDADSYIINYIPKSNYPTNGSYPTEITTSSSTSLMVFPAIQLTTPYTSAEESEANNKGKRKKKKK